MHPPTPIVGKTSYPEQQVFNMLAQQLGDDHVVLHSVKTYDHESKPTAEADFVVVSPLGIMVIEVKGDFTCEAGIWRYSDNVTKTESPLVQAEGAMFSIKRRLGRLLQEKGHSVLAGSISYGSSFISVRRDLPGDMVEIPSQLFMGPRKMMMNQRSGIRDFLTSAQLYWSQKYPNCSKLSREEVQNISLLLRPDVNAPLDAYTNLKLMDGKIAEATQQQHAAIQGALANSRLLIGGMAGTGKTLLAVNIANSFSNQGKKVLFLCFNDNLRQYLSSVVAQPVIVSTVHKILVSGTSSPEAKEYLREYEGERLWREGMPMVYALHNEMREEDKCDVLIVDEAQDVMSPAFIDALSSMVKGGFNSGRVILFYDPKQDIYGDVSESALNSLNRHYFFRYTLTVNCRNTREVASLGSIISEVDIPLNEDLTSGRPQSPKFTSKSEILTAVVNQIEDLSRLGMPPDDIVVLSPRTLENSIVRPLSQGPQAILAEWGSNKKSSAKAYFSTIHGFKGLEAGAVIIVDLDLATEAARQQLLYVACTRAKAVLCPALPDSNKATYESLARSYGVRISKTTS